MEGSSRDIFESDYHFLQFSSTILVVVGLVFLLLGLSCKIVYWGYCDWKLVSIFAYDTALWTDFVSINLPLAILIIGVSLKLFSRFGWVFSVFMLSLLFCFFSFLSSMMILGLKRQWLALSNSGASIQVASFWESLILDTSFSLLCMAGVIFLFSKSVRRQYWNSNFIK